MATAGNKSYHALDGLERAVVDLVRVGTRGHGAGVRQLASRLMRSVPTGVQDIESFRDAVHQAIAAGSDATELRYVSGASRPTGTTRNRWWTSTSCQMAKDSSSAMM